MTERTWLESIEANHGDSWTREMLIKEAQRTHLIGSLPAEFAFLRGAFADLGFENLGLRPEELEKVRRAFVGTGLVVPGTTCRLRCLASIRSVVEAADGNETATLPGHWKQGVVVLGLNEKYTWIGKRVRQDQHDGTDLAGYDDAGDGWFLRQE